MCFVPTRTTNRGHAPRRLTTLFALVLLAPYAHAQDPAANYPNRAIRVVVPYPPGGTSDTLMRLIGQKLTERWG